MHADKVTRTPTEPNVAAELPFASVVVPSLNEKRWIATCIESVLAQDYPAERREVIVVDNGSTDGTVEIAGRYPITLLHEPRRSSYAARNRAIRAANGEFIAFTDADCVAERTWLVRLVEKASEEGCDVVGGNIVYDCEMDTLGNRMLISQREPETRRSNVEKFHSTPGGNLLVRRSVFERFGLFQETASGGDVEFSRRLAALNSLPRYAEKAVVHHKCDLTNYEYLHRTFRVRYGQELLNLHGQHNGRLWELIRAFPWRPGFRRARTVASIPLGYRAPRVPVVLGYSWLARLLGYVGGIAGCLAAKKNRTRNPDDNANI